MTPDERREYNAARARQVAYGQSKESTGLGLKAGTIPITTDPSKMTFKSLGIAARRMAQKGNGLERIEEMNQRQGDLGRQMQEMAMKILESDEFKKALAEEAAKNPDLIRKFIETGVKIERMSLANPIDQPDETGARFEFGQRIIEQPHLLARIHGVVMEAMDTDYKDEDVIDMQAEGIVD